MSTRAASTPTLTALRLVPVLAAALIGMSLIFVTGFAPQEVAHNAAHDTRHAFAFPCH